MTGTRIDLHSVNDGGEAAGIAGGACLIAFAEAIVSGNDLAAARQRVISEMGAAAMVDAAGVASNFQRMVRIADGTGITLGDGLARFSSSVRQELQLERFLERKI